jgi:hypothetical protein
MGPDLDNWKVFIERCNDGVVLGSNGPHEQRRPNKTTQKSDWEKFAMAFSNAFI